MEMVISNHFLCNDLGTIIQSQLNKSPPDQILVGGFSPCEKYACQIGSFPQVGMNIKKYLSCHQPEFIKNSTASKAKKSPENPWPLHRAIDCLVALHL